MAKYSKKRVAHICSLIRKDSYTIAELCTLSGISETTFYDWQVNKPEFSEAVTRAREQFDEILVKEAKNSLRKLVNGYDVDEKKTVFMNHTVKDPKTGIEKQVPRIKEQTTTIKHIQPNPGSVEFVLTNKKPDEYKNRHSTELTGKGGKDLFASLANEELDARIAELEKKLSI
jgi:hypothetical protein